jgi:hypothetical protein
LEEDAYEEKIVGGDGSIPIPKVAMPSSTQQISIEDVRKMKVKEIKEHLEKRGQSTAGNKGPLAEQLRAAIEVGLPVLENIHPYQALMNHLDATARWDLLPQDPTPIPQPVNNNTILRPPTERDAPITKKFGYSVQLDREPFSGTTANLPKAQRRTQQQKKKRVGKSLSPTRQNRPGNVRKKKKKCVKGGPNVEFLRRHMLDVLEVSERT